MRFWGISTLANCLSALLLVKQEPSFKPITLLLCVRKCHNLLWRWPFIQTGLSHLMWGFFTGKMSVNFVKLFFYSHELRQCFSKGSQAANGNISKKLMTLTCVSSVSFVYCQMMFYVRTKIVSAIRRKKKLIFRWKKRKTQPFRENGKNLEL